MDRHPGMAPSPSARGAARRVLHLTLHRRWFDAIASGEKKAEYRLLKPYWAKRLEGREYDEIHFRNGYAKDAPFMRVEWCGYEVGSGGETLPAPYRGAWIFAIRLGKILEIRNYNAPPATARPVTQGPDSPNQESRLGEGKAQDPGVKKFSLASGTKSSSSENSMNESAK